jgi:hypothetical protein
LYARYLEKAKEAARWKPTINIWPKPHNWQLDDGYKAAKRSSELIQYLREVHDISLIDQITCGDMCRDLLWTCNQKLLPGIGNAPKSKTLQRIYA